MVARLSPWVSHPSASVMLHKSLNIIIYKRRSGRFRYTHDRFASDAVQYNVLWSVLIANGQHQEQILFLDIFNRSLPFLEPFDIIQASLNLILKKQKTIQ